MGGAARKEQFGLVAHSSVAAVVTICANRKRVTPDAHTRAESLPLAPQSVVETAWLKALAGAAPQKRARELYAGRSFRLAAEAASLTKARLYIVSAGLGFLEGSRRVPSYGITVSRRCPDSVPDRVSGEFDAPAWFRAMLTGKFSSALSALAGRPGRILIALTRPYAEMIGESLAQLEPRALDRVRIFGAALAGSLPSGLCPMIAPYDGRLDRILPGTRVDFSQRALLHFVQLIAGSDPADRQADFARIERSLQEVPGPPNRVHRPRRSDDEILQLISAKLQFQVGIARILRALRDEEGVACEQARFSRLYRAALQRSELL